MGTGYTRNDTTNNIADGNVINADDLDGEFDALQSAFNNTTGHTHDGTTAEGAPITVTGPAQEYVSTGTEFRPKVDDTYDLGSASNQWRNLYVDGVANIDSLVADTADINGGTIDGATIGNSTPAAIKATSITGTSATINGNITVTGTVDGRDVAADGSKLDGIEANAKDDQTITAGSGLTGGGTGDVTLSHADTSSQASVNNSGVTYIQDVTLDTYGHVTALGSGTVTLSGLGYTGATNADNYSSWSARDADGTTYTVTSGDTLQFAEGTGIDVNFTADDVLTITNTAPDQTVVLTEGANITISGTYPNFTIAATDTNTTYSAGTGLNLVGTTFNNTAPDRVVSLTGSGGTSVSGTYPNFTISSTDTNTTYSAGALLDLSGTTFAVDLSELTDMTATMVGTDEFVVLDASAQRRKAASEIGLSIFNNDAGYTTNIGDITGVTAGSGLTGGGTSGAVTVSHADTSSQASVNNSGGTVIQDVTLDTYGHVTGLTSYNLDSRYYTETEADSRFVNVSGDTMTGDLTIPDKIIHSGDTNTSIRFPAADTFTVETAGSERMRIDSSGNVGIAGGLLEIYNGSSVATVNVRGATNSIFRARQTGNTGQGYFAFGREEDIYVGGMVYDHGEDSLRIVVNNSERMCITSDGNVGIGTSDPSERVEIYGASPYILLNNTEESSTGIKFADAQATEQTAEISAKVTGTTAADVDLQFIIGGNDRMSVYGDGDVKIFGNNTTTDTRKFTVESEGYAVVTINGDVSNTSDEPGGSALQLAVDGTGVNAVVSYVNSTNDSGYGTTYTGTAGNVMLVGTINDNPIYFGVNSTAVLRVGDVNLRPLTDNVYDLGTSSRRYDDVYATNGTIQTSDRNEKQQIAELTTAEMQAATTISKLFKTFKWNDSVVEKGDDARIHTGVIAQEVEAAMADAGLDAGQYAFFISSTWWESTEVIPAVEEVLDEEGNVVTEAQAERTVTHTHETAEEAPEGAVERTRKGIRYPQLLSFIGAATEQRLTSIEARITALEAQP